jgi:hypothetical protein
VSKIYVTAIAVESGNGKSARAMKLNLLCPFVVLQPTF